MLDSKTYTWKKRLMPIYDLGLALILILSIHSFVWQPLKSFWGDDQTQLLKQKLKHSISFCLDEIDYANITEGQSIVDLNTEEASFTEPINCRQKSSKDYAIWIKIDFSEPVVLKEPPVVESPLVLVEQSAQPIEGFKKFIDKINKKLKTPKGHQRPMATYKCYIELIVEKDGSLSGFKNLRGEENVAQDAISVLKETKPKWIPATHHGKKVRQRLVLPFTLKLS